MAARVILAALLALAAPAAADPAFGWTAPAGCPRAEDVRARVERRLGGPIDGAVHGVEIAITRDGSGFVAQIDARALTVANDVRRLTSTRCDALADAIAVVLSRLATEARGAPAPVLGMTPPTPPVVASADVRSPEEERVAATTAPLLSPAPAEAHRWGGGASLIGLSGIGALPGVNLGGGISGYVRRDRAFAELALARWVPQSARYDEGAPARVDVSLDVVSLRAGWGPEELPLRAWLSGEVGTLRGSGMSVVDPQVVTSRWIALGFGFAVAWPMSPRTRLVGTFETAIPLQRTIFQLSGGADLFQPAPAAVRCGFGLEVGLK